MQSNQTMENRCTVLPQQSRTKSTTKLHGECSYSFVYVSPCSKLLNEHAIEKLKDVVSQMLCILLGHNKASIINFQILLDISVNLDKNKNKNKTLIERTQLYFFNIYISVML